MGDLLLTGIGHLTTNTGDPVSDAAVAIESGTITYAGPARDAPSQGEADRIDCEDRCVIPGFVDAHTHLVFAGDRSDEFARKMSGASYQEIAASGGGIHSTVGATRAATEEGILPGGGVPLLRAQKTLKNLKSTGDERIGVNIVRRALEAPLRQIVRNAGIDSSIVVQKVSGSDEYADGYNAATATHENLLKAGVIDPTKVTRTALANAASVATLLLTSDALVAEMPKDDKKKGHGGDYDMY